MFTKLTQQIEVASFGASKGRILIFRSTDTRAPDTWQKIPGTQTIIVGGDHAKTALTNALKNLGRTQIEKTIPGSISGRTLTNIRRWLGIPGSIGRPKTK